MSDAYEMPKAYDPTESEAKWYEIWENAGYFAASGDTADARPTYTIAIPPPNVTGSLHMGHACRITFEDVLVRYKRMAGFDALWIPGTDHAGIATQVVVERKLKAEGKTRYDLGRAKFIERVWAWKAESGATILRQQRKLGGSCDWSRTQFTMDPAYARAVREAFVRLYEEGLIYRATRLVNWDVESRTVLSDLEVETKENVDGELYEFAYMLEDGSGEVVVATTRPETMLGDTALAIHPEDPRYAHLHGKFVKHPFVDRRVPIVCDAVLVDPKFGTGVVKVTPAHDFNDFATGKRHGLEEISILELDGKINANGGEFVGLDRFVARKAVKAKLEALGLARGSKKHMMTLPISQRSGTVVEPMISTQWFVRMEPLAKPAIEAVEDGRVQILPEDWKKTYFHFLRNIQEWCISRQLWWGHAIPAFYCNACEHVNVSREDVTVCAKCGSADLRADEDVLDTWFSSALWPFATLGWPEKTPDLSRYYPTSDLETGYDILFFWVARMIMMGMHFMGEVPFKRVLLAGLVCDERGEKMSKVKGNVIDPLDVIYGATFPELLEKAKKAGTPESGIKYLEKTYPEGFTPHGADALRMTLLSYAPQSMRIALSIKRVEGYRNFANKLWNAARFSLMKLEDTGTIAPCEAPAATALPNRYILSELARALDVAATGLEAYRLDEATQALYHFVWDELCDWYLELSKPLLESEDAAIVTETRVVLAHVLETTLRALHPMMPFITEEIWQRIPKTDTTASIMLARYPTSGIDARPDEDAEKQLEVLRAVVSGVRGIRAEHALPRMKAVDLHYFADANAEAIIAANRSLFETLACGTLISHGSADEVDGAKFTNAAFFIAAGVRVVVPDVIDTGKEKERLTRELKKLEKDLGMLEKKLENPSFMERAPADVVAKTHADIAKLREESKETQAALEKLGR